MLLAVMQAMHDGFAGSKYRPSPLFRERWPSVALVANPAASTAIASVAHGSCLPQFTGINETSLDASVYGAI